MNETMPEAKVKTCRTCGKTKPLSEFGIKKGKLTPRCRACLAESKRAYYAEHKEKIKKSIKEYYEKNKETILARDAERRRRIKAEKDALKPKVPDGYRLCRVCGKIKPLNEFNKNGPVYRTDCIECKKKYAHKQYVANIDENREKRRQYDLEHAEQRREYRFKNRDYIREKNREWHLNNKDRVAEYRETNKEHIREKQKEYRENNKEYLKQLRAEYYVKNPHYHRDYDKQRIAKDPLYKFKKQIRNAIRFSFKRHKFDKSGHTAEIVGCDIDTLVEHLKETYRQNYGIEWNGKDTVHIDHIIPLATAKTEDEILELCHYTNLQMLTPEDNMKKGDKDGWEITGGESE